MPTNPARHHTPPNFPPDRDPDHNTVRDTPQQSSTTASTPHQSIKLLASHHRVSGEADQPCRKFLATYAHARGTTRRPRPWYTPFNDAQSFPIFLATTHTFALGFVQTQASAVPHCAGNRGWRRRGWSIPLPLPFTCKQLKD